MLRYPTLTAVLLLFSAAFPLAAADAPAQDAIVLCYHVVESPKDTPMSITRSAFRQQIEYLSAAGYSVISLADLTDYVAGRRDSIPERSVVITVDDGYRCNYTEIYPVMKEYDFPFTVFLYPQFIGQSSYALTWKQVKEMSDEGVDIQSHTYSHAFLTHGRQSRMGGHEYEKWLDHELAGSKKVIEKETGKPVKFLAYPYGDYDSLVATSAAAAGYDAALTCNYGPVRRGSDPFLMRRVMVYGNTTFEQFRRNLGNSSLPVERMTPAPGKLFDSAQPVISAKISGLKWIDPSSIGIAVLSLGKTSSFFDKRDGTISLVVRDEMKGRVQHAVVWGRDKRTGRHLETSWTFYVPSTEVAPTSATPEPEEPRMVAEAKHSKGQTPSSSAVTTPPLPLDSMPQQTDRSHSGAPQIQ